MKIKPNSPSEAQLAPVSGWLAVCLFLCCVAAEGLFVLATAYGAGPLALFGSVLIGVGLIVFLQGFFILQPNEALVGTFFGDYRGSCRQEGFWFINPLMKCQRISLKAINHATATLKVNDLTGSPIEIAAIVTWSVSDTRKALFEVEDWRSFVSMQCESALRQIASLHPYERASGDKGLSLRSDIEAISREAQDAIQAHVEQAGIAILDARVSHLAYASEIAQMMLRRQQAQAMVQARAALVEGAVGMVKGAIESLSEQGVATLTDDQKAILICNMMTVLASEEGARPVLSLGAASPSQPHSR